MTFSEKLKMALTERNIIIENEKNNEKDFNQTEEKEKGDTYLYNVPIKEAARLLNKSEQFVRVSLQQGTAPFGFATKKEGKEKYSYHISPKKLYEYIDNI